MTGILLHSIHTELWEEIKHKTEYRAPSLETEGFIHCSMTRNVLKVANFLFQDEDKLILLCINPEKLNAKVKFEAVGDDVFPHIYGALNMDAVEDVLDFEKDEAGHFMLPQKLLDV